MPKAEEIKRHEMQVYDAVAEAFGSTWARYTSRFAADMIDLMFPQKGEAALDIAGGTGAAGLRLAERIGKDGSVIITDISPGMLWQAQKEAAARGLTNVSTRAMDAEKLEFPDSTFDLVTCSFGVMFFPGLRSALAEARRVLKPGGRIGFTVWSDPSRVPFITLPATAVITRFAPAPVRLLLKAPAIGRLVLRKILVTRGATGPSGFRFSKPGSLEKHLRLAGFHSARRELRAYPMEFATFENYWDAVVRGSPAGQLLNRVPAAGLEEITGELRSKLANPHTGAVYVHNEASLVLARRPL